MITDDFLDYGGALQREILVQGCIYIFGRTTLASIFGWDTHVRKCQY
jgi:hypothetical protein